MWPSILCYWPRQQISLQTLSVSPSTVRGCPPWPLPGCRQTPGRSWQRWQSPGQSQQLLAGLGGREGTLTGQGQGQEGRRCLGMEEWGRVGSRMVPPPPLCPGWSRWGGRSGRWRHQKAAILRICVKMYCLCCCILLTKQDNDHSFYLCPHHLVPRTDQVVQLVSQVLNHD